MKVFARVICFVLGLGLFESTTNACLWDRDTIAKESVKLPGVMQIMSGNFARHSKEFYTWRRDQCVAALAKDPNKIPLYDDLAVAYHKLGDQNSAISTMLEKDKRKPGLYETYSNLGTFYIYTNDLKKAVQYIARALAVNPNAHFGREKYQKWLVEWVLAEKPKDFAAFVVDQQNISLNGRIIENAQITSQQRRAAINGVLGMMLFADYDNPLLQEALGDLLSASPGDGDASSDGLAYAAYTLALKRTPRDARESLLKKANEIHAVDMTLVSQNLAAGETLSVTIRQDEMNWIAAGLDANVEFEKKYLKRAH